MPVLYFVEVKGTECLRVAFHMLISRHPGFKNNLKFHTDYPIPVHVISMDRYEIWCHV